MRDCLQDLPDPRYHSICQRGLPVPRYHSVRQRGLPVPRYHSIRSTMKIMKLINLMILLFFLKFVNSDCIKKCICFSESDLRCFNFEMKDYNDFVALASKRRNIHFYKSVISVSKLTTIMPQLYSITIAKDCHLIDCFSHYKTHISGCNDNYNEGYVTTELYNITVVTTELYNITVNNTNITWITPVGCVLVVLILALCITVLR
jgi:hypothetical protein